MPSALDLRLEAAYNLITGPGGPIQIGTVERFGRELPFITNAPTNAAAVAKGYKRVYAGRPDRSFLFHKINGTFDTYYASLGATDELYHQMNLLLHRDGDTYPEILAIGMMWAPEMRLFRQDPRFQDIAQRLGLMDYWKQVGPPDACTLSHPVCIDTISFCKEFAHLQSPPRAPIPNLRAQAFRRRRGQLLEKIWEGLLHARGILDPDARHFQSQNRKTHGHAMVVVGLDGRAVDLSGRREHRQGVAVLQHLNTAFGQLGAQCHHPLALLQAQSAPDYKKARSHGKPTRLQCFPAQGLASL